MREVMLVSIITEVRDQFVEIVSVGLEGTTGGEVDISNDLVHPDTTRNIAAFVCLFSQLICPTLVSALQNISSS
jgi:hypothetical protein